MPHFKFQYDLAKGKQIAVAFEVIKNTGNRAVFQNITMKPNYYDAFLLNLKPDLQLIFDDKGNEYKFWQGYFFTNGDFRQIIERMLSLANVKLGEM